MAHGLCRIASQRRARPLHEVDGARTGQVGSTTSGAVARNIFRSGDARQNGAEQDAAATTPLRQQQPRGANSENQLYVPGARGGVLRVERAVWGVAKDLGSPDGRAVLEGGIHRLWTRVC